MNLDQLKFKLTAVFEPAAEGGFTCHFEEWPEIFSEGETVAFVSLVYNRARKLDLLPACVVNFYHNRPLSTVR